MLVEENKAVLKRIMNELWNKRDISLIPDLITPNYIYGNDRGHEGYKEVIRRNVAAFPDYHFVLEEVIGEGDRLAGRLTASGTMKGKWRGFEPTGKHMSYTFAVFWRFENGKLAESVGYADNLLVYRQLGIPIPAV